MARTKKEKIEIIEKVDNILNSAKSLSFVNFKGLTVAHANNMRREMKKDGVKFFVSKKSLAKIALDKKKYEGTLPDLQGEFGFAYGEDLIAPSRLTYDAEKKYKGEIKVLGGVFEGRYMTRDEIVNIASIPPMNTLLGMFVNVINSPIQGLVIALDQIAKKQN